MVTFYDPIEAAVPSWILRCLVKRRAITINCANLWLLNHKPYCVSCFVYLEDISGYRFRLIDWLTDYSFLTLCGKIASNQEVKVVIFRHAIWIFGPWMGPVGKSDIAIWRNFVSIFVPNFSFVLISAFTLSPYINNFYLQGDYKLCST